ncbi:methyltransferase family protein [Herbihabitans rhizosphaerae]|uniref:Methyltransferase family protein n=1 Tax=Herbihabitans rhizosphaerae TaxID=1872711 RepID=A0A4Q7L243_9PSEU|nr:class I SAM-dependent methyltransferase [Herbihabitans rhizosphaerae]RZS43146.1 methyltransferase family protein [Herbihabitans rhizosphaerae]
MPTLPPDPEPHRHRDVAESFGTDAARYDRARPRYPSALIDRIVAASPGTDVLDVGCGTGIAARQFRAAGCTVLGVEPDARMAEFARRDGLDVEVATFEDWDSAGRTFDAVVAGQAWHWVDPAAGAAKAAGVLRPGGLLSVFWHVFDPPAEVTDAFAEAYRRVEPDTRFDPGAIRGADVYQVMLTRAADAIGDVGGFDAPDQWRFEWEHVYTRDAWLDQLPTFGPATRLRKDKLAVLQQDVGAAIDAVGGSFTMRYTTAAVAATRTA